MSFLTALASAYGGYGAGKQKKYELDEQRREADQRAAYEARSADISQQELTLRQQQLQDERAKTTADNLASGIGADGKPLTPYKFTGPMATYTQPKTGPDPQGEALHHMRLAAFLQTQGPQYAWQAQQELDLGKAIGSTAGVALNQAKTTTEQQRPSLIQAQTAYWKDKPAEFQQQLKARLAIASAADKAKITAAGISANAAAARATSSSDERMSIALMAQLNAAGGMEEKAAVAAALAQWKQQQDTLNKSWQSQEHAYSLGIGPNPGVPQQVPMPQPVYPPAPNVTYVFAPAGPNGAQVKVPIINRGGQLGVGNDPNANNGNAQKIAKAKAFALSLVNKGQTPTQIADGMRQSQKFNEAEIQQVISGLPQRQAPAAPLKPPLIPGIAPQLLPQ